MVGNVWKLISKLGPARWLNMVQAIHVFELKKQVSKMEMKKTNGLIAIHCADEEALLMSRSLSGLNQFRKHG